MPAAGVLSLGSKLHCFVFGNPIPHPQPLDGVKAQMLSERLQAMVVRMPASSALIRRRV